jgi:hypothetical protein
VIESEEYSGLRNIHSGRWLHAHEDGTFNAEGTQASSRFHIESTRDGGVSIKAHNTSWYLGVSMFGHIEPIDSEQYDRAHWKAEVIF